ncbi:hypothetical protein D5S17_34590 [Pseudonocardiaceae bacterium YIM PH 21723]|nr:hypothetical protein D5S17_34590 [Pseudonocardiaceae bacterium YIM PH 21723]
MTTEPAAPRTPLAIGMVVAAIISGLVGIISLKKLHTSMDYWLYWASPLVVGIGFLALAAWLGGGERIGRRWYYRFAMFGLAVLVIRGVPALPVWNSN